VAAVATSLLLAPTAAYAHPDGQHSTTGERTTSRNRLAAFEKSSGPLRDLQVDVTSALDGAAASATMVSLGSTLVYLKVHDVNTGAAGQRFGAHLHEGPCVTGNGVAALGHYNVENLAGLSPYEISPDTEVWLDFEVNAEGQGRSTTTVPFVPTAGTRSIVIHASPTMDSGAGVGTAGARIACLPFTID
jgi:Cu-Zn family superoxide dismutase